MSAIATVSVIIPVFNGERYIRQAIRSVLAQTFEDIELLVVDDGSTDGTAEAVRSCRDRIHYTRQPNGGASKARNEGIRRSRGRYIAFLDADDLWRPEKLALQVEYLERHAAVGLVHCDVEGIDEEGRPFIRWQNSDREEGYYWLFMQGHAVLISSAMFRRALLERSGLFDEEFKKAGLEDIDFWSRMGVVTGFSCMATPLVQHRMHRQSTCRRFEGTAIPFKHRRLLVKKMMSRFGDDEVRRRFLQGEMVSYRSDLGKWLVGQGRVAAGRKQLLESIVFNLRGPRNLGKLGRSVLRLARSVFSPGG